MNTKIVKIAGITMALFLGLMMVMPVMNVIAADHNTEIHADPDRYTIMAADNWEIHGEDGQHFVMAEHSTEIHYILTKCEAVENQFMLQKFDGDACVGVAYMNGWDASTVIDNWGAGMTIRAWDAGTIIDGDDPIDPTAWDGSTVIDAWDSATIIDSAWDGSTVIDAWDSATIID